MSLRVTLSEYNLRLFVIQLALSNCRNWDRVLSRVNNKMVNP